MAVTEQLEIAYLIREVRRRLRLTQEQFAHKLGVTCLTVNRWENGHSKPSPMAAKLIQGVLMEMGDSGKELVKRYRLQ